MRFLILVILVASLGCANRGHERLAPTPDGTTIAIGQPWSQARRIALIAGYELHDASQLAMDPAPDGFYIDMSGRRGLLIFREPRRDVVKRIEWVENWDGPKEPRVYHEVPIFEVPAAARTEGDEN